MHSSTQLITWASVQETTRKVRVLQNSSSAALASKERCATRRDLSRHFVTRQLHTVAQAGAVMGPSASPIPQQPRPLMVTKQYQHVTGDLFIDLNSNDQFFSAFTSC